MTTFASWDSYLRFIREVKWRNRYDISDESVQFVETLKETCIRRVELVPRERILWRSQIGTQYDHRIAEEEGNPFHPEPFFPERMKPLQYFASEGRANPRGIPYLYMAGDPDTAIAEVRPAVGAYVSVAEFRMLRDLRLVNCIGARIEVSQVYPNDHDPDKREQYIWNSIDDAFAWPVAINDNYLDYIPTQMIAELFRNQGYDGIIYRSSQQAGMNYCLFHIDAAKVEQMHLYHIKGVSYVSEELPFPTV